MSPSHGRSALLLAVYLALLVLTAPGLSTIGGTLSPADRREALREGYPPLLVDLADGFSQLSRLRDPVASTLGRPLWLLGIRQSWNLYGNGPDRVRRVEVRVDGVLRYRSNAVSTGQVGLALDSARIRSPMARMIKAPTAQKLGPLFAVLVRRARQDVPDAEEVSMQVVRSRFPGEKERVALRMVARGPDWVAEVAP